MRWLLQFRRLVASLLRHEQAEADLEDELRDHLEQETRSNTRAGMSEEDARYAAQRLVGSVGLYKEQCRDARGIGFIETLVRDLRYAFRMLRRTPLFTAVAMLTLAIAIGANTTVFTFLENVLMRSLPVHEPERVVVLNWGIANFSYPNYLDFRDRNSVFSGLVAYRYNPANMSDVQRGNFRSWGYEATGNYFETLGVLPKVGRFFGPRDDDRLGANPVVVISYRCWQGHFGGDPAAVGRTLKINGFPFTIIGVAGEAFRGTELIIDGDYWVPMSMYQEIESGSEWMKWRTSQNSWVLGRLKPGVSRARAERDLDELGAQIERQYPNEVSSKAKFHLSEPGLVGDALRRPVTAVGMVLMAVAGLGLMLACVNVAGMLLARASDRRREIGIRLAIGASRGQLLRQLMTESFLLAAGGGIAGYGVALGACHLLSLWRPAFDIPIEVALAPNGRVLLFMLAACGVTTMLCGLAPALQSMRIDLLPSLKSDATPGRFQRWSMRDLLVTGQIALSVVLVICSVLVVRSLQHALTLPLGFNPSNAVSVSFDLGLKGYDSAHIRTLQAELLRRASTLPGVERAGICNTLPLNVSGQDNEFVWPANEALPKPADRKLAMMYNISPQYLEAAGTRLMAGRDIDEHDRPGSQPVAIVNETFGRMVFGGKNLVGRQFHTAASGPSIEVVGVVEDGKYQSLGEDKTAAIMLPIAQRENRWTTLVVRTHMAPSAMSEVLRKTVLGMDSEITVFNAGSLEEHLALPLFGARMAAIVLGMFGVFAMVLAAIGLFALMSYAVSRRTREIGIRMALGAERKQVLSSLLMRTLVLCGVGIVIGAMATMAAGGLLSAVLYGVSPRDPITYGLVLCLMVAVAMGACWMPAMRAIRIDPMRALREE